MDASDILNIRRIGQKNQIKTAHGEETVVPRLSIVTLHKCMKTRIMKNVHKLQNANTDYYKRVRIKHDMSGRKKERLALRKEAKAKNEVTANINGNLLYLVRGLAWDRHIFKVKEYQEADKVAPVTSVDQ